MNLLGRVVARTISNCIFDVCLGYACTVKPYRVVVRVAFKVNDVVCIEGISIHRGLVAACVGRHVSACANGQAVLHRILQYVIKEALVTHSYAEGIVGGIRNRSCVRIVVHGSNAKREVEHSLRVNALDGDGKHVVYVAKSNLVHAAKRRRLIGGDTRNVRHLSICRVAVIFGTRFVFNEGTKVCTRFPPRKHAKHTRIRRSVGIVNGFDCVFLRDFTVSVFRGIGYVFGVVCRNPFVQLFSRRQVLDKADVRIGIVSRIFRFGIEGILFKGGNVLEGALGIGGIFVHLHQLRSTFAVLLRSDGNDTHIQEIHFPSLREVVFFLIARKAGFVFRPVGSNFFHEQRFCLCKVSKYFVRFPRNLFVGIRGQVLAKVVHTGGCFFYELCVIAAACRIVCVRVLRTVLLQADDVRRVHRCRACVHRIQVNVQVEHNVLNRQGSTVAETDTVFDDEFIRRGVRRSIVVNHVACGVLVGRLPVKRYRCFVGAANGFRCRVDGHQRKLRLTCNFRVGTRRSEERVEVAVQSSRCQYQRTVFRIVRLHFVARAAATRLLVITSRYEYRRCQQRTA